MAPATHGETVSEVLGSGNGSQPYQRFTLRQAPLTYVSAETPSGTETTLQVRVNDVLWHEAPTLFGRGPRDRVYTTRAGDDGKVTVLFGDGRTGARLPSGTENVRATYRKGIGKAGNVKAGQLSLLLTRPLGVRAALNPLPAAGGDDPETLDRARRNAPLTVLTLDRIVSLRDYEDFARAFAGIAKALATWTWDGERQGVFVTVAGVDGAAAGRKRRDLQEPGCGDARRGRSVRAAAREVLRRGRIQAGSGCDAPPRLPELTRSKRTSGRRFCAISPSTPARSASRWR